MNKSDVKFYIRNKRTHKYLPTYLREDDTESLGWGLPHVFMTARWARTFLKITNLGKNRKAHNYEIVRVTQSTTIERWNVVHDRGPHS